MPQIFISYRRTDSFYAARGLKRDLDEHFGPDSVFYDVDTISLGADFTKSIDKAIAECLVVLVIIGDQWLPLIAQKIDDPEDYVRVEIEAALKRKIPVIPVLVEQARMPSPGDLPASIRDIAKRQAAELRADRYQAQHTKQLIDDLEKIIRSAPPAKKRAARRLPVDKSLADVAKRAGAADRKKLIQPKSGSPPARPSRRAPGTKDKPSDTPISVLEDVGRNFAALMNEIHQGLGDLKDERVYADLVMPEDKVESAIKAYAPGVTSGSVLLLFDNTVFGTATTGLILTADAVYWHNSFATPGKLSYADIDSVKFRAKAGLWSPAQILINGQEINVVTGDSDKIAQGLVRAIHNLASYTTYENKKRAKTF